MNETHPEVLETELRSPTCCPGSLARRGYARPGCGHAFRLTTALLAIACAALPVLGQYTAITIPKGYVQVQGDVITTQARAAALFAQMEGIHPNFAYAPSTLWPNRIVPYDFDPGVTVAQQAVFQAAMSAWENSYSGVTTISFQPRNNEAGYVHLVVANPGFVGGSTDNIGYDGAEVTITIHPSAITTFLIAHELGHALGLWHEQSRNDRNSYLTVVAGNILPGMLSQFNIASPQSTFGPYDYDSIMQYAACSFSICTNSCGCSDPSCATMLSVFSAQQCNLGQQSHLSAMDQRAMAFMYGPPDWKFLYPSSGSSSSGTFQQPFSTAPQAANAPSGSTVWIGPGTYSAAGVVFNQPMILRAAIADLQLQADGSLGPSSTGYAVLR